MVLYPDIVETEVVEACVLGEVRNLFRRRILQSLGDAVGFLAHERVQ